MLKLFNAHCSETNPRLPSLDAYDDSLYLFCDVVCTKLSQSALLENVKRCLLALSGLWRIDTLSQGKGDDVKGLPVGNSLFYRGNSLFLEVKND